MAFTRIGDIAARLIADPAKLAAAAQDTQRNEGGREPVAKGVSPSSLPVAQASGRTDASNGIGKKAGTPVSETSRPVEGRSQQSGKPAHALDMHAYGRPMPPALRLVSSKCLLRKPHTEPHRVLSNHLVLVVDHQPAPKSIPARKTRAMTMASVMMF
jgi:hypothetical protein